MTELSGEHKEMMDALHAVDEKVDKLWKQHEVHLGEGHEMYVRRADIETQLADFTEVVKQWLETAREDRETMKQSLSTIDSRQEALATVVLGESYLTYDGELERTGGMQAIVKDYQNGGRGLKAHISWQQITALIGTLLTVGGGIVVAIINTGGG